MPINYVSDIAQKLIQNGSIEKPGVGISYYMMTDEDATKLGRSQGSIGCSRN